MPRHAMMPITPSYDASADMQDITPLMMLRHADDAAKRHDMRHDIIISI